MLNKANKGNYIFTDAVPVWISICVSHVSTLRYTHNMYSNI